MIPVLSVFLLAFQFGNLIDFSSVTRQVYPVVPDTKTTHFTRSKLTTESFLTFFLEASKTFSFTFERSE
jgi:hypothetical protein